MERYETFCKWDYIKLKKEEEEVYKITLSESFIKNKDGGERNEYLFGVLFRRSFGDQFSFIEYVATAAEQERIPDPREYIETGLEPEIEKQYRAYLQRILKI
jgi:hypothetical protein